MNNTVLPSLAVKREELPLALLMFAYFFLVITCFWILKPIKKGLFIQFYDQTGFDLLGISYGAAQAELLAKILNMVVAFLAVVVFTHFSRRFRKAIGRSYFVRSVRTSRRRRGVSPRSFPRIWRQSYSRRLQRNRTVGTAPRVSWPKTCSGFSITSRFGPEEPDV